MSVQACNDTHFRERHMFVREPRIRHRFGGSFQIALSLLLLGAACPAAAAGWSPRDTIEIVVGQGPGGGTDTHARVIQKILQGQLLQNPVTVMNKSGGGGAIGLDYLRKRPADGHNIAIGNATLLSSHIVGGSPLSHNDVTPLALLAREYVAFAVKPDSPLRTGTDLLARLKENPASLSMAIGAAVGNQNHIAIALAAKTAGIDVKKFRTVIFKSSGETVTAILGGHVDVAMTSLSGFAQYARAGTLRLIVIAAPKRTSGDFASVPTWREQGVDSVAGNWFAAYGPKGMGAAQIEFWDGTFARLVNTDGWKEYEKKRLMYPEHLGSEATGKFFRTEYETLKNVLTELGLAR